MRLIVLYREHSDHSRAVFEFVEMLSRRYPGRTANLMDIDSREGAAEASLYGITRYPALIVTAYDGRVIQQWEGMPLPLIDEVAAMILDQYGVTV
jgi:hypothetical protein